MIQKKTNSLLQQLLATYTAEKANEDLNEPAVRFVYRPLSFYLAALFLKLKFSANAVTLFSCLVAFSLPLVSLLKSLHAPYVVSALAFLFQVLDCADGSIARLNKTSSNLGSMLDSLASMFFWMCFMLSVGLLAHRAGRVPLAEYADYAGLVLAIVYLAHREIDDTCQLYLQRRTTTMPAFAKTQPARPRRVSPEQMIKLLEQLFIMAGLPLAAWLHLIPHYFGIILIYQGVAIGTWFFRLTTAIRRGDLA